MKIRAPYSSLEYENEIPEEYLRQFKAEDEFMNRLQILHFKEMMKDESERVTPDTFGCDGMFARHFITDTISEDFPKIVSDFLKYEGNHLSEYISTSFADSSFIMSFPTHSLEIKMMNIMLTAARKGSEYTIKLFQYLYKTYYRNEYKQLKRFKSISDLELLSLAENPYCGQPSLVTMSRILTIAPFFQIEIEPSCSFFYALIADRLEELEAESYADAEYPDFSDELFQECKEKIQEMAAESTGNMERFYKKMRVYKNAERFISLALQYYGYPCDYTGLCNGEFFGLDRDMSITLMLLKKCFPNKEFSLEEIQLYAAILYVTASFCCSLTDIEEWINHTLCGKPLSDFDEGSLFCPDKIGYDASQHPKPQKECIRQISMPIHTDYKQDDLLEEINELRSKLHHKEQEYRHMSNLYLDNKKKLSEANAALSQYQNEHEELIALREHVYLSTETDTAASFTDLDHMTKTIANRRIVIIGGHDNWMKRLKTQFENWVFFNSKTSGTIDERILDHADYVYFFTDFIKHSTYYRFINVVRNKNIPFGYIHSTNFAANVKQIYNDMREQ